MTDTIRALTWNLWWRFGPWEARQPAILDAIADARPDLCCFQEVIPGEGITADQAEVIADRLGFDHVATSFSDDNPWMGNAVVSRWPLHHVEVQALPTAPGRRALRTAVHAVADGPVPIPVTSTHLTWEYDESATRVSQARALVRRIGRRLHLVEDGFPPLLCGDLNATPDSDEVRLLTGRSAAPYKGLVFVDAWPAVNDEPGMTWHRDNPHLTEATWPHRRLDYVLVGWPRHKPRGEAVSCEIVGAESRHGVVPSDHYGVVAELRVT